MSNIEDQPELFFLDLLEGEVLSSPTISRRCACTFLGLRST
jgi:hypothetical protein